MRIIEYRGKMLRVAERIEEFTPAQYRRYLEISIMADRGIIDRAGLRSKLLTMLLNESVDISIQDERTSLEAFKLIRITEPFIVSRDRRDRLNLETGENLLKEWNGWFGPGDMLSGLTFGKFIDCDTLLKLIARSEWAEERERLTVDFCKKMYSCPSCQDSTPDELLCAHSLVLYNNVMQCLRNDLVDFNGERLNFSILFEKSDKRKPDDHTGWTGAAMDIAETGVFGTYQQVVNTQLWDVLLFLYRKKFDYLHNHSK